MNCARCSTPIPAESPVCVVCGTPVPDMTVVDGSFAAESGLLELLQAAVGEEYTIERELGRGGMGAVFLASEPGLKRNVAIKMLPPFLTMMVPTATQRFLREAQMAATLDHPNIIPIYRVSQGTQFVWYVMKYVVGESLDHVLAREHRLPLETVTDIVAQVADALDYAHSRGVIHRDIKPGNVIVDTRGGVTVTDFGIARRVSDAEPITLSGAAMGTPLYISPEQCAEQPVTAAADQYALAVMTFQMLAGRAPFSGSLAEIVKQHVLDPVPSLAQRCPGLPTAAYAAVERALAKKPEERFPSVGAFAQELGAHTPSRPSGALVRVSSRSGAWVDAPTQPLPTFAAARWPARRVALYGALGLAVAATVWIFGQDRAAAPSVSTARAVAAAAPAPSIAAPAGTGASKAPTEEGLSGGISPQNETAKPVGDTSKPVPAAVRGGYGRVSVTTSPASVVTINGRHVAYPVYRYRVPAGDVRLRFLASDSAGTYTRDTVIIVKPGEEKRLGALRLGRP